MQQLGNWIATTTSFVQTRIPSQFELPKLLEEQQFDPAAPVPQGFCVPRKWFYNLQRLARDTSCEPRQRYLKRQSVSRLQLNDHWILHLIRSQSTHRHPNKPFRTNNSLSEHHIPEHIKWGGSW